LAKKIREKGTMLGKVIIQKDVALYDPNTENLVAQVSTKKIFTMNGNPSTGSGRRKKILLLDCGAKNNIAKNIAKRDVEVTIAPWNYNPFEAKNPPRFDALIISNGPGDPKMADKTITTVQRALEEKIPLLGVCLGNQILSLAAGGNTYKLKYGHRSQNQPCIMVGSNKCFITTQNHGFAVDSDTLPKNFKPWFVNANDHSNEGIIHTKLPIMSVKFHPEAYPGPVDTEWIFDYFLDRIDSHR
jgi:carbamoyl-phosphate synthase small subunit